MNPPEIAVVVSTIGRVEPLRRLLHSLEFGSAVDRLEVVVVDQSDDGRCAAVLAERDDWPMRTRALTSGRGASVGRNVGLAASSAPVVVFPDDDAWYPPDTLAEILERFAAQPPLAALCGRQVTGDGRPSMLRWSTSPGHVTARNFLRTSIMSTMFFRRSWLDRVTPPDSPGPFAEDMGVGTSSWYGACEESDLLLRVIEAGGEVPYRPELLVYQDEPRDTPDAAFVRKMLRYGCGQGHLWRVRELSRTQLAYYLARKVVAATVRTVRGDRMLARADLAWLRGNVAGFVDVEPRTLREERRQDRAGHGKGPQGAAA